MQSATAIWFLIALAFLAANLPFFTERLLGLVPLKFRKNFAVRLGEMALLYFIVGGVGLALEGRAGRVVPQGWEFYAITGALFLTLAFPGFVWRYLTKRHG